MIFKFYDKIFMNKYVQAHVFILLKYLFMYVHWKKSQY